MLLNTLALTALALRGVAAQVVLSGCANETVSGSVEYACTDSEGSRTVISTYGVAPATTTVTVTAAPGQTTAVTDCHTHSGTEGVFCTNGAGTEVSVAATPTGEAPSEFTGCHDHGAGELYCFTEDGDDVPVVPVGAEASESESEDGSNVQCHDHAGVPHCVGGPSELNCGMPDREYNYSIRIGMVFVVLVTSGIGVFAPLVLSKLPLGSSLGNILTIVKQFGTGIIISTAFIHLYSHATLYLNNDCISWPVYYEGTTSAIVMAGIFISFLIDYLGHRIADSRRPSVAENTSETSSATAKDNENKSNTQPAAQNGNAFLLLDHHHGGENNKLSVSLMEAGIIFHSILIGLILVVTPDESFNTLLVVVIFHQIFEGLALGARISLLPNTPIWPTKFVMAALFMLITPIGMAIGIGVLDSFNGNDPSTMIAFGTLNALSAGILIWVGVVDMWARDWVIEKGELLHSGTIKTIVALVALMSGIILMSVLGKWA